MKRNFITHTIIGTLLLLNLYWIAKFKQKNFDFQKVLEINEMSSFINFMNQIPVPDLDTLSNAKIVLRIAGSNYDEALFFSKILSLDSTRIKDMVIITSFGNEYLRTGFQPYIKCPIVNYSNLIFNELTDYEQRSPCFYYYTNGKLIYPFSIENSLEDINNYIYKIAYILKENSVHHHFLHDNNCGCPDD